jgi:hypothetical protein
MAEISVPGTCRASTGSSLINVTNTDHYHTPYTISIHFRGSSANPDNRHQHNTNLRARTSAYEVFPTTRNYIMSSNTTQPRTDYRTKYMTSDGNSVGFTDIDRRLLLSPSWLHHILLLSTVETLIILLSSTKFSLQSASGCFLGLSYIALM